MSFGHNVIIAYSHAFNLTCSRMRMHIFTAILVLLFLLLFGTVGENSGCPSLPLIYFSCSISFLIFVPNKYGSQTESYFQPYQKMTFMRLLCQNNRQISNEMESFACLYSVKCLLSKNQIIFLNILIYFWGYNAIYAFSR